MLISHHPPSQYCRTYKILGIRFCARCSGIIIGILLIFVLNFNIDWNILILLPLPTFINFLFQELKLVKSLNYLKTFLTIPLGVYLFIMVQRLFELNFILFFIMFMYLLIIEFIIAFILNRDNKLEQLINVYEEGMYRK